MTPHSNYKEEKVIVPITTKIDLHAYRVGKDWLMFLYDPEEEKIISKYPQVL